jgi:regulator of sirC expression with transglutaminase-like and TPR domain
MEEIRDRGLAYAQLDYLRPALKDLTKYLHNCPDATDANEIRNHIADLEKSLS